jgi:hypothetical protein
MKGRSLECEINSEEIIESQRKVDLLTCQSIIYRHNDLSTVEFPTLHTPIMPMVMRSCSSAFLGLGLHKYFSGGKFFISARTFLERSGESGATSRRKWSKLPKWDELPGEIGTGTRASQRCILGELVVYIIIIR